MRSNRLPPAGLAYAMAFLLSFPILLGCGDDDPATYRVLLIGDSITEGTVSRPRGRPFADLLVARLPEALVVNAGLAATSSGHWAPMAPCPPGLCAEADELLEDRVAPHLPVDLAVVMLGSHDAVGGRGRQPTPVPTYNNNIIQTSLWLLKRGAGRVLLVGPPPSPISPAQNGRVAAYGRSLEPVCRSKLEIDCHLDLQALLDPYQDFAPRDLHPNGLGHAKIAASLLPPIRSLLGASGP